jgi:hypothetical protein
MSWLSEALHGRKSLLQNLKEELTGVAGSQVADVVENAAGKVVHDGAEFVIDNAEKYKALIEAATRAYLVGKLGTGLGGAASAIADIAVNALVATVEGAAHALADDKPD